MRAAEAIVSSAPKPMKIFPIREVWSQVELSLLAGGDGRGGRLGRGYRRGRARRARRRRALAQRAIDVVELIGGNDLGVDWARSGVGGGASAGLSGAACRISLARAVIALAALPVGVSAMSAGAVARWRWPPMAGSADDWSPSSARVGRGLVAVGGFRRDLAGSAMRVFFPVVRAVSGVFVERDGRPGSFRFRARGRVVRARRRRRGPRETHKEPGCQNQRRAPAGFDGHSAISPFASPPGAKRDLGACPQRGKKRESSGDTGRKRGNRCGRRAIPAVSAATFRSPGAGCQPQPIDVMSLRPRKAVVRDSRIGTPRTGMASEGIDHDFVI